MFKIPDAKELAVWSDGQNNSPDIMSKMIFDAISDPLFILSKEGEILLCNRACGEILKMPVEKIVHSHCYEVVHKLTDFTQGCPFVKSMSSGKRETYQAKIFDRWSMVTVDPITDDKNEILGAIHLIRDIDDIITADTARRNLSGIVENTADAIAGVHLDDTIEYWNLGAEEVFGYTAEEIIGKNARILITEEGMPHYEEIKEKIKSCKKIPRFESIMVAKSGKRIEVSLSVQPMFDERKVVIGNSFIANDISEIRKAERELLYFATESVLRLEKPVEIIENNLADIKNLLHLGKISQADAEMLLDVQIKGAEQIIENVKELKAEVIKKQKDMPKEFLDFLTEQE